MGEVSLAGKVGLLKQNGKWHQIQVDGSLGASSVFICNLETKITHKQILKSHYVHTVPSNIIRSGINPQLHNKCYSRTDCFIEEINQIR